MKGWVAGSSAGGTGFILPGYILSSNAAWGDGVVAGVEIELAGANKVCVSSNATTDTSPNGNGARTVRVCGVDANYVPASEVLSLLGQNKVTSVESYIPSSVAVSVLTTGANNRNDGIVYCANNAVTVTNGVPQTNASIYSLIPIQECNDVAVHLTVPAGKTYALTAIHLGGYDTAARYNRLRFKYKEGTGPWRILHIPSAMVTAATTGIDILLNNPVQFNEKTEIRVQSFGSAAGSTLIVWMEFEEV